MKKFLRPVALVLPGLIATSSFAAWTPSWRGSGNGFSSAASVNGVDGYTEGKYQGASLACTKYTYWRDRVSGDDDDTIILSGMTLVINSGYWSENTYSIGLTRVYQTSNAGNYGEGQVDSSIP